MGLKYSVRNHLLGHFVNLDTRIRCGIPELPGHLPPQVGALAPRTIETIVPADDVFEVFGVTVLVSGGRVDLKLQ